MIIHKHKLAKTAKGIGIAIGIMILLALLAGGIYVYLSGKTGPAKDKTADETTDVSVPLPTPKPQPVDAVVGAAVEYISSPIKPGDNAEINVHTNTKADCSITVKYNQVPATDSGLIKKTANDFGSVGWTWTVPANTPVGSWPVTVTCSNAKKSAVVAANLVVIAK